MDKQEIIEALEEIRQQIGWAEDISHDQKISAINDIWDAIDRLKEE